MLHKRKARRSRPAQEGNGLDERELIEMSDSHDADDRHEEERSPLL